MANRHQDLTRLLQALQLSHTASSFAELAMQAAREGLTHEAFLYELAEQEYAYRKQRRSMWPSFLRQINSSATSVSRCCRDVSVSRRVGN